MKFSATPFSGLSALKHDKRDEPTAAGRRPAADVAAVLGLSIAAVQKYRWRVKEMVIQEHGNVRPINRGPDGLP
jgi:hypothetical protein